MINRAQLPPPPPTHTHICLYGTYPKLSEPLCTLILVREKLLIGNVETFMSQASLVVKAISLYVALINTYCYIDHT